MTAVPSIILTFTDFTGTADTARIEGLRLSAAYNVSCNFCMAFSRLQKPVSSLLAAQRDFGRVV